MRKLITTGVIVAAGIGLSACNSPPAEPAAPATEELPVEEPAAPATDSTAIPTDDAAMPTDAMSKAGDMAAPEGGAPSSSTGGRVTPPSQ